jgi:hypothetical protein
MVYSVILIEGQNLNEETLGISLGNAKQIVIGYVQEFGYILDVTATSPADLGNALVDFAQVPGVSRVLTLALRVQ